MTEKQSTNSLESNQTELSIPALENSYKSMFKQITKLGKGDIIVRSNCKFCNHPLRNAAEERFERNHHTGYTVIESMFRDFEKKNPDHATIGIQSVRNHLLNHYLQQEKQIQLREYAERKQAWINYKISKDQQYDSLSVSLLMQFEEIAADPKSDPLKKADALCKLSKTFSEIDLIQAKLRGELHSVQVLYEKLAKVWLHIISMQDSDEVKSILMEAMHSFESDVQSIDLEE